jgi:hypothetical protein
MRMWWRELASVEARLIDRAGEKATWQQCA